MKVVLVKVILSYNHLVAMAALAVHSGRGSLAWVMMSSWTKIKLNILEVVAGPGVVWLIAVANDG